MIFLVGLYHVYFYFCKKLLSLLMLEASFLSLVFLFFFQSYNSASSIGSFPMMLLLSFLVMDSVLGLCCLIFSSRSTNLFLDIFHNH